MANPALNFSQNTQTSTNSAIHLNVNLSKDTFIFDGNSKTAHLIARTLLVNDPSQKIALMPKQNMPFFGIDIPYEFSREQFILLGQDGEIHCGKSALALVSKLLNLQTIYH